PRIHFAINCASRSCPDLRVGAYLPRELDAQLESSTRRFLADTRKGMRIQGERLFVSPIFKWFRRDFAEHSGSVLAFIGSYAPKELAQPLSRFTDRDLAYLDYDWSLNDLDTGS
ncbi:MAG: DUF547 domain-containing protein, partial [Myxococcota bacterium]